ncbi:adenylyl cyclase [Altericroceibacterium endophyticum]|uniref:Adenylyl cyclase n=1 Tax=Altericroceibacterium endophyticum TaxID=1808508 RepID=A0A6I4TAC0_9SPHN|nr:adenylyl cyclase [Altericroceibacterium endophyticum]MXO67121.1 adenylyl cyclase [Altericroceibacterium endophyticum]
MRKAQVKRVGRRKILRGLRNVALAAFTSGTKGGMAIMSAATGAMNRDGENPAKISHPDFGPHVLVADPAMPPQLLQDRVDAIFMEQEAAHFTDRRHAILFLPGQYQADIRVGFFTQVLGVGTHPGDVGIDGHVRATAEWLDGNALANFWRGAENLTVKPVGGAERWAVSQAAPYRRIDVQGDLLLHDGGSASGGFMADCRVTGTVHAGSQQQWFTRSGQLGAWEGCNWNMMFMGVDGAPPDSFPEPAVTRCETVPVLREKPFLYGDDEGDWGVCVPALQRSVTGTSWQGRGSGDLPPGRVIPLREFLIARPEMSAGALNAALSKGQHLLFTPGVYRLEEPLNVTRAGTVILGLGLATLKPVKGTAAMQVADVPGVSVAGLIFDAGEVSSPVLLRVGPPGSAARHRADPILLADLYFRVGGVEIGRVKRCLEINCHDVIGDHLWIWRADHGDVDRRREHFGWDESTCDEGIVVNGDDVTIYALFVEHFQKYQTYWTGERGRVFFYQSELPYDPPDQSAWMAGSTYGWASYKVADNVQRHAATALGIYAYFRENPSVKLESAVEAPHRVTVRFRNVTTYSLGGGVGTIRHLVNDTGKAAQPGAVHQTLKSYP